MDHEEIVGRLSAYLDNAVGLEEKEAIKHHLGRCGSCREVLADLEWTVEQLKRLPDVEPPLWLTGQIMTKVLEVPPPRPALWRKLFFPLRVKLPLQLGILILLGLGGYRLGQNNDSPPPGVPFRPAPSPTPGVPSPRPAALAAIPPASSGAGKAAPHSKVEVPLPALYPRPVVVPASIPVPPEPDTEPAPALPGRATEPGLQPAEEWTVPRSEAEDSGRAVSRRTARQKLSDEDDAQPVPSREAEVVLTMKDPAGATEGVERAVTRSGGRIRGHSYSDSHHLLFAQVEAQMLPGLLDRLARLGSLQGRPAAAAGPGGNVDLVIRW